MVSVCECIVDEHHEMIPAYEIVSKAEDRTSSPNDYNTYIKILEKHSVPCVKEFLDKMFMLDYLMLNEDRHLGNFGVIRNVETLCWESVCPIYDTGRSLNTNVTENYWDFKIGEVKCFTASLSSSEILPSLLSTSLRKEQINQLKELVPFFQSLLKEHQLYLKLFDEQIDKIICGLNARIEIFQCMMIDKGLLTSDRECDSYFE